MNIFYLDQSPALAAQLHHDKHVVKMILESAQMLSTTVRLLHPDPPPFAYKTTHAFHPCTMWVRQSQAHFVWLQALTHFLNLEYQQRFSKPTPHRSSVVAASLQCPDLPKKPFQAPPQVMPPEYTTPGDPIGAYRRFYALCKAPGNAWYHSPRPPAPFLAIQNRSHSETLTKIKIS